MTCYIYLEETGFPKVKPSYSQTRKVEPIFELITHLVFHNGNHGVSSLASYNT